MQNHLNLSICDHLLADFIKNVSRDWTDDVRCTEEFNVRKILELHFIVQFSPESYIHRGSYYQNETRGAPG